MDNEIGELMERPSEVCVDWRIPDFLSLPEGAVYYSPVFPFTDAAWYFQLYPHGLYNSGVVSLYLQRDDGGEPRSFTFSLGLRKADGKAEERIKMDVAFRSSGPGVGELHFLDRDKLRSRSADLAPAGVLTVTCNLESWSGHPAEVSVFRRLWNLSANLKKLLSSGEGSDVVLRTRGGAAIPAHQTILRSRSPALARLLDEARTGGGDDDTVFGRLFEAGGIRALEVQLEDEDEEAVRIALRYVYGGEPDGLRAGTACGVYAAARRYGLPELGAACERVMRAHLSPETVCEVIAVADSHGDARLMRDAREYFARNKAEVTKGDRWARLKRERPQAACEVLEYSLELTKT